ncbi:MAG: cupin domain-containing protein [Betaproteobacteria bacterium]
MNMLLVAPATVGIGFAVVTMWALNTDAVRRWRRRVREFIPFKAAPSHFMATGTAEMQWLRNQDHPELVTYFMKPLFRNARTGDITILVRYPAGEINPRHTHPVGHGMYVLKGTLVTHRGTFGRDTFVWFPPNEVMFHGAGPEGELVVMFMTSVDSCTDYVRDSS